VLVKYGCDGGHLANVLDDSKGSKLRSLARRRGRPVQAARAVAGLARGARERRGRDPGAALRKHAVAQDREPAPARHPTRPDLATCWRDEPEGTSEGTVRPLPAGRAVR